VRIRPATPADIPHIRQLEQGSDTAAHWSSSQYDALLSADGPARIVLVAAEEFAESPIMGFLIVRCLPEEWEIENIVVDQPSRRRGIGSLLVRHLLPEARAVGLAAILLEVRESNRPAIQLYESIGFRQEGRRRHYYRNPQEDALLFRFLLQSCDKIP